MAVAPIVNSRANYTQALAVVKDEMDFLSKSGKSDPKGGGILGALGLGKKSASVPAVNLAAVSSADAEHFTMELLEGPQARTVEFTRAVGGNAKWQSNGGPSNPRASTGQPPSPAPNGWGR